MSISGPGPVVRCFYYNSSACAGGPKFCPSPRATAAGETLGTVEAGKTYFVCFYNKNVGMIFNWYSRTQKCYCQWKVTWRQVTHIEAEWQQCNVSTTLCPADLSGWGTIGKNRKRKQIWKGDELTLGWVETTLEEKKWGRQDDKVFSWQSEIEGKTITTTTAEWWSLMITDHWSAK